MTESDLKPETPWSRLDETVRSQIIWGLWAITECGLLIGYWRAVVFFSAAHALFVLAMFRGQVGAFPVQVRVAYFLWVAVGTFVPSCNILMYITIVGNAANLSVDYCPLARMMSLLSWNRSQNEPVLTTDLIARTFLSPPSKGRFQPTTGAKKGE